MVSMLGNPRRLGVLLWALPLLLSAACGSVQPGPEPDTGGSGRLDIVAALYPFQFIAERVAGDHATVTSLTEPGAEPHDVELKPSQVASLTGASLVVYEKTFQPAVDEAVLQSGNPNIIDTATVVRLKPLAAGDDLDHGHDALDPHVWLDPQNMITITDAVRDKLATLDPRHAGDYTDRSTALKGELSELDRSFASGLKSCVRQDFITTHAAFGYLARRYHLNQIGISGITPDAEPSPARIAEIQDIALEYEITTIFTETLVSPAVAESIADDLDLATDVLDPIEGITAQSRGQDYVAVMKSNLAALRKAGGCS
jgi:zinc transport system substrate-binding protein